MVSQLLTGDEQGGMLATELLNACFDLTLPHNGNKGGQKSLDRLMATLAQFNAHMRQKNGVSQELFSGNPEEVAAWAEDLTWQIWQNRPN